jgi:hypothetical protein
MTTPRKDSDNLAIIERLKPKHAAEINRKIRLEAELERGERDVEELLGRLEKLCGTRDINQVRDIVKANYTASTEAIDRFGNGLNSVIEKLAAIDARG